MKYTARYINKNFISNIPTVSKIGKFNGPLLFVGLFMTNKKIPIWSLDVLYFCDSLYLKFSKNYWKKEGQMEIQILKPRIENTKRNPTNVRKQCKSIPRESWD